MSFNFPDSPTPGQQFEPLPGIIYEWQSPVWKRYIAPAEGGGGGGGASVTIADEPPAPDAVGALWYESDFGNTYIWYDDGDSSQWIQQNIVSPVPAMPTGLTAETRNRLVNPCFQIQQDATMAGSYVCDQWIAYSTIATTAI